MIYYPIRAHYIMEAHPFFSTKRIHKRRNIDTSETLMSMISSDVCYEESASSQTETIIKYYFPGKHDCQQSSYLSSIFLVYLLVNVLNNYKFT